MIHTHLTNDHILAVLAAPRATRIVRTFHSRRVMRNDPGTRLLVARSAGICVVNASMLDSPLVQQRPHLVTPPPLDTRQFHPNGADARADLGVAPDAPLIGFIGKVAPDRGFETAIHTLAAVRMRRPQTRLMIIGKGPHRESLERLAAELDVADAVSWAGYRDRDLASFYRAADVMLFTAPGSDHGHRAILEELGCGIPVVSCPLPGVDSLLGPLAPVLMSEDCSAESVAARTLQVLDSGKASLRDRAVARAREFDYAASARRLLAFYESIRPTE